MSVRIFIGDVLERIAEVADESIHCVVTSPPYWGLRDYGTGKWEGGDAECDHRRAGSKNDSAKTPQDGYKYGFRYGKGDTDHANEPFDRVCGRCGARRVDDQLGLEATPEEHVEHMVGVFREVRRVMRHDATLWMNYGDGYQDKQLVGMPWRVVFALQADGWYLRSDIIWAKPNPMPESVTDRPTKSHEHVFLLAKSQRYYYDADAVREEVDPKWEHSHYKYYRDLGGGKMGKHTFGDGSMDGKRTGAGGYQGTRNLRDVWTIATQPYPGAHFSTFPPKLVEPCIKAGCPEDGTVLDPFGGAGTVGLVADRLGRDAILIELNEEYARMAERRIREDCPMFTQVETLEGERRTAM